MSVVSTDTAEHYTWGDRCDGWHLHRSAECSVIQELMPPGTSERAHYHHRSRQFFYVLSGTLSILLDGTLHLLGAEQGIEVAPMLVHRVYNDSGDDARFIVISTPPSHGDRVDVM